MKQKKIYKIFLLFVICIQLLGVTSNAHPGRTDANGGHYDRSTGEYHYHHGYEAHQHINGICPYDYNNNEKSNSYENSKSNEVINNKGKEKENTIRSNKEEKKEKNFLKKYWWILCLVLWIIIPLICDVYDYIKQKFSNNKKNIQKNNNTTHEDKKEKDINSNNILNSKNRYICPKCGGRLCLKHGKYGTFIGCSNYPKCTYTKSLKNKKNKYFR